MKLFILNAEKVKNTCYLTSVKEAKETNLSQLDDLTIMLEGYLHFEVDDKKFYYLIDIEHEHKDVYVDDKLNQIYPSLLSAYKSFVRGNKINMLIN